MIPTLYQHLADQVRFSVADMARPPLQLHCLYICSDADALRRGARAGDSWAHAATNRVILHWQGAARSAHLYKSPSLPARSAEFLVCGEGVRGRRPPKRTRPEPLA